VVFIPAAPAAAPPHLLYQNGRERRMNGSNPWTNVRSLKAVTIENVACVRVRKAP
jgi:hypothetical protein